MLSVWWGVRGNVYWELIPNNKTVTAMVYCAQLDKLKAELKAKHREQRKVYFLHENDNFKLKVLSYFSIDLIFLW